jgi:nitrogen fixation protein FixH
MTTTSTPKPFSPWPYAIIGYFIVFITGIAVFIAWAVTQDMDLVRKDYYDHEILFQQQIDRQKRTAELGAQAAVNYDATAHAITIQIPASHVAGANGTIHFYRPSDAKLDHKVRLAPTPDGTQQINVQSLRVGLWKVAVQWTAGGQEYHLDRAIVIGG